MTNLGRVEGLGSGIVLAVGGRITNGSATNLDAFIRGGLFGVRVSVGRGVVSNEGTIVGRQVYSRVVDAARERVASGIAGVGVALQGGGKLVNGAASHDATIKDGSFGVEISGRAGFVST